MKIIWTWDRSHEHIMDMGPIPWAMTITWSSDPTHEPNVISSGVWQSLYMAGLSALTETNEKLPYPDIRISEFPENRISRFSEIRISEIPKK